MLPCKYHLFNFIFQIDIIAWNDSYFERDVQCVRTFFNKRFGYNSTRFPKFERDIEKVKDLDVEVAASGYFTKQMQEELASFIETERAHNSVDEEDTRGEQSASSSDEEDSQYYSEEDSEDETDEGSDDATKENDDNV